MGLVVTVVVGELVMVDVPDEVAVLVFVVVTVEVPVVVGVVR